LADELLATFFNSALGCGLGDLGAAYLLEELLPDCFFSSDIGAIMG
jgi:hypothetical protein